MTAGERTTQDVARNIVNQLADLWEVDPMTRQATNDQADAFVARLIADYYLERLLAACLTGMWRGSTAACHSPPWATRQKRRADERFSG
jgi:hypothetical protein